ncbi:unnamed protein product [Sphagnum balticum]
MDRQSDMHYNFYKQSLNCRGPGERTLRVRNECGNDGSEGDEDRRAFMQIGFGGDCAAQSIDWNFGEDAQVASFALRGSVHAGFWKSNLSQPFAG